MSRLETVLERTSKALDELGARWALVGGLAVSVRTEPRFTRDIDVAIAVEQDSDAENLVHELSRIGFRQIATVEQVKATRLATVRMRAPGEPEGGIVVDLLFSSSGIEGEVVSAAERLEVTPGVTAAVAQTGHLLVQKLLSQTESRPNDAGDIVALIAACGDEDLAIARESANLVTKRGYNRGRDLTAALEQATARAGG